jgi:HEAT repeat protein
MCRSVLVSALVCLSWWAVAPTVAQAGGSKRPVADLVADLHKGEKEQLQAIEGLAALGEKAAEAAPALVEVFRDKNEYVRLQTAIALGKVGRPAVEPLTHALGAADPDVRFYAAWGLAFVGPPARGAAPAVVKALADSSAQVRRKAAYALGRIDPEPAAVVEALVAALGDADGDVRQAAQDALPKMGRAAVPALVKVLHGGKEVARDSAIRALGQMGADAADAVADLKAILLQPNKGPAQAAADALAGIGAPAVGALVAAAAADDATIRTLALQALHRIGVPAVPALVDLLGGSKHADTRRQAASLIGAIPVNDKMVIVALGYAAANDKDFQVRVHALQALRGRGPGAKLAEPYVSGLLTDIDPNVRQEAFHTLQALGVDPRPGLKKALGHTDPAVRINTASLMAALNLEVGLAEPILLDGLKEKDLNLKMQAAHALALRGLQADAVLPILLDGLKSEVASVRRQAAEAIVRYGPQARKASPALIAALDDPDDAVRGQALAALRQVGEEPKALLPAMLKILRKKDDSLHGAAAQIVYQVGPQAVGDVVALLKTEEAPALRLVCLQTLAMVGPSAKEAVDELIRALGDPAPRARMAAARALGNIGPDAKAAVDALARAEKDSDANVRQIAAAALVQVRGDAKQKGFQVQGVLTAGDPFDRVRSGCFHVVHTYPMKAGQTYTIDLRSTWDNFLRLENAKGEQLAQDDDSGGFPNARIVFTAPQDGWYRIIVTSFAPGANGGYTLTVR